MRRSPLVNIVCELVSASRVCTVYLLRLCLLIFEMGAGDRTYSVLGCCFQDLLKEYASSICSSGLSLKKNNLRRVKQYLKSIDISLILWWPFAGIFPMHIYTNRTSILIVRETLEHGRAEYFAKRQISDVARKK